MSGIFESSRALQLFPTVVFQFTLRHGATLNRKFEREVARLREAQPLWKGLPSPWQCAPVLHQQPVFEPLVSAVGEAVRGANEALKYEIDGHKITGMWANWLRAPEMHPPHHHANNFWSGVYWVRVDDPGHAPITFSTPNAASRVLFPRVTELTMINAPSWSLDAVPGVLTLFPAWLTHHVPPVPTGERVSIAFNVIPRGPLGTPDSLQFVDLG